MDMAGIIRLAFLLLVIACGNGCMTHKLWDDPYFDAFNGPSNDS
jgi:hypothetical protein